MKIKEFLESDKPGKLKFFGSETADLFSKEIAASFEAVLRKNYITEDEQFMPGFITASVDGRPWYNTMWTRDVGTFIRELVLWGHLNHACLASDCLIKLVEQNEEGYFTFPEYFKYATPASGDELDGTLLGWSGYKLLITGGTDKDGFPMRRDLPGAVKKRALISGGVGYHPIQHGARRRKTLRGREISTETGQINLKILTHGAKPLGELIKPEEAKEKPKKKTKKRGESTILERVKKFGNVMKLKF